MQLVRTFTILALAAIPAAPAFAQSTDTMTAACGAAAQAYFRDFEARTDMQYNGQRVDGTHAVNGQIFLETRAEDFACSFAPDAATLVEFFAEGQAQDAFLSEHASAVPLAQPVGPLPELVSPPPMPPGDPPYLGVFGLADDLSLHAEPSADAAVVGGVPAGTVLRNFGCTEGGIQGWCEVAEMGADGPTGWASADYLEQADSSLRAGQGAFDATGPIACAQADGEPMTWCNLGVARDGGGTATVVITRPDGRTRAIFFIDGVANGADTSEADGYHEFSAERQGDVTLIRVGPERYEIPDAVIFGG